VRNPSGALRSSQYVRARVVWKTVEGLVVPVTAVSRVNGQFFAFVAENANGKLVAHQRAITIGQIVGDDYPVLNGLKPGERIVVSGSQKLVDGAPIAAVPDVSTAGSQPSSTAAQ
jgi:multidrug efflux pump subunit AcrA (membrane-fusion protein)